MTRLYADFPGISPLGVATLAARPSFADLVGAYQVVWKLSVKGSGFQGLKV